MDEFLVSIFRLKYVIGDIEGSNVEHHLYVFHMPGIKMLPKLNHKKVQRKTREIK